MWVALPIVMVAFLVLWFFNKKGVPVLLYHQIGQKHALTPELFEQHLQYINKLGMVSLTLTDLHKYRTTGQTLPKNAILITFDDGYYDNYQYAFPLLKKYHLKATIFLNTFYLYDKKRKTAELPALSMRDINRMAIQQYLATGSAASPYYMNWDEIGEMHQSGLVDFQAHSHKHMPAFTTLKLTGIISNPATAEGSFLYLAPQPCNEGFPVLKRRGETSVKGLVIAPEFYTRFAAYFEEHIKPQNKTEEENVKLGQAFIDTELKNLYRTETGEEAAIRIRNEVKLNKQIIEGHLHNNVHSYCWPWGHRSAFGMEQIEKEGYVNFITTCKGTNNRKHIDIKKIRRIELRNPTQHKMGINILIARNLLLGKLYELVS